jgi:hypothetical protein
MDIGECGVCGLWASGTRLPSGNRRRDRTIPMDNFVCFRCQEEARNFTRGGSGRLISISAHLSLLVVALGLTFAKSLSSSAFPLTLAFAVQMQQVTQGLFEVPEGVHSAI